MLGSILFVWLMVEGHWGKALLLLLAGGSIRVAA